MRDGWPARLQGVHLKAGQLRKMYNDYGEPETLLAREFDLDQSRLIYEMAALWGKSFTQERDERAGPDANAQKKSRVARQLKAELKAVLDGDD